MPSSLVVPIEKHKRLMKDYKVASAELRASSNLAAKLSRYERDKFREKRYGSFLQPASLYKLDTIPLAKKLDGRFIRASLIELYKDNMEALRNRYLFGRMGRKELPPEKVHKLRCLVDDRVSLIQIGGEGRNEESYVNKHIVKQLSYIRGRKNLFVK